MPRLWGTGRSPAPAGGDYGALGVSMFSSGLTLTPEPITTVIGLGIGVIDATGGFNSFYGYLDSTQSIYNATGQVYLPNY